MIEESVIVVIPLPARVLSPNVMIATIRGRYAKVAATKRQRRLVREAVEAEQIETAPWQKVVIDTVFYHKRKGRHDEINAQASLKAAHDGIVDAGLVEDDDSKHVTCTPPKFYVDKVNPRVVLTIRRVK